jgi:hypothetical protein
MNMMRELAEIIYNAELDFVLFDFEHGAGDGTFLDGANRSHQLQSVLRSHGSAGDPFS